MSRAVRRYVALGECHHSASCYENGCPSPVCRELHRRAVTVNRLDRLELGRLHHGTRSSYDAGCRCCGCTAARGAACSA